MDFTVFAVRQHGATSADPPLEKRADCIDSSGHGTAAADRCSPIMYLQVLLFGVVGQLSSASSDGLPTTVTEDSGVCSGTPLSSFSAHHSLFSLVSDGLPPNLDFTVFAVRQHGATSADPPLQKRAGCMDTSGHGTAAAGRCSPIMYLQVAALGRRQRLERQRVAEALPCKVACIEQHFLCHVSRSSRVPPPRILCVHSLLAD
ncbi:uncharacterized protein LOC142777346 isoform X2 [Rhipicephalus microplus]|uniref:uncharacterized protein LOC142777346 isoform X2 n=1 Tax=Rhipicephalus microplus TaxID=6941 RepID=UPI003F6BACA5